MSLRILLTPPTSSNESASYRKIQMLFLLQNEGLVSAQEASPRYAFDNDSGEAANQLAYIGETTDSHTRTILDKIGVSAGWRCWDVGAGAGTIAHWLAERVGPDGQVLASDVKPQHIAMRENLRVQHHDIRIDPLPAETFDLVHSRLLLMHLPDREHLISRMAAALRPGGRLVVSDWQTDHLDLILDAPDETSAQLFQKFLEICRAGSPGAGIDTRWATRANRLLRKAGLTDVTTEIHAGSWAGGSGACLLHRSNTIQLESGLLSAGFKETELQRLRDVLLDPRFVIASHLMFTTVGTFPG